MNIYGPFPALCLVSRGSQHITDSPASHARLCRALGNIFIPDITWVAFALGFSVYNSLYARNTSE